MAYIDGVVKKTTNTLLMVPADIGDGQPMPNLWRGEGPSWSPATSKLTPPSPILQGLQSNREGGYFSMTSGFCDTERQKAATLRHTPRAVQSVQMAKAQEHQDKDSLAESPDVKNLVEAMKDLNVFSGLRPGSRRSQLPPSDASAAIMEQHISDASSINLAEVDIEADREATTVSVENISSTGQEELHPQEVADCDQAASNQMAHDTQLTKHTTHSYTVPIALSKTPVKENSPQGFVRVVESDTEETNREDVFEDIPLDSPTLSSPTPSAEADPYDFEEVIAGRHQTKRNGLPGMWGRWIQRKN